MKAEIIVICILLLSVGIIADKLNTNNIIDNDDDQITRLHHVNDSLIASINKNDSIINSLTSINTNLENQIKQDKEQLTQINNKAKFYEKKYNEEKNRINNMSNDDVVKEFISVFSN